MPHRLELVGERDGVRYVNDSKATNVSAALRALAAYADEPVHLILGGSPKGEDFAPLAAAIGPNVRSVHLIGEEAERLAQLIDGHRDGTLDAAVAHAAELAQPGDVVLLSPACCELRPVRELRGTRRRVPRTRRAGVSTLAHATEPVSDTGDRKRWAGRKPGVRHLCDSAHSSVRFHRED